MSFNSHHVKPEMMEASDEQLGQKKKKRKEINSCLLPAQAERNAILQPFLASITKTSSRESNGPSLSFLLLVFLSRGSNESSVCSSVAVDGE